MFGRLLRLGLPTFALAFVALGVETMVCAQRVESLGANYWVIPRFPGCPPFRGRWLGGTHQLNITS